VGSYPAALVVGLAKFEGLAVFRVWMRRSLDILAGVAGAENKSGTSDPSCGLAPPHLGLSSHSHCKRHPWQTGQTRRPLIINSQIFLDNELTRHDQGLVSKCQIQTLSKTKRELISNLKNRYLTLAARLACRRPSGMKLTKILGDKSICIRG
jgi:hypothetical protein